MGETMKEERRSITRSKRKTKPEIIAPSPMLYTDAAGKHLYWDILGDSVPSGMTIVPPKEPGESERYRIRYAFVGGKDQHAVKVHIDGANAGEHDIKWIYVRSYTGGQIRFIKPDQDAHALLAMAEDDAYMFCQNDPCIECAFACKVGFEIFAYSESEGLLKDAAKIIYSRYSRW